MSLASRYFWAQISSDRKAALAVILISTAALFSVLPFLPNDPRDPAVLRGPFAHQSGYAYVAHAFVPFAQPDDRAHRDRSTLQVYEDGKLLGPQHVSSDDIAREGRGMYLFWRENEEQALVFSASDGGDPNTNGRTYRVIDPQAKDPYMPHPSGEHLAHAAGAE